MAVANYHDVFQRYPPAVTLDASGRPAHSWRILVLPYIEQNKLYEEYSFDEPWDGPNNSKLASRMPPLFAFAGTNQDGTSTSTNYVAVTGPETVWPSGRCMVNADIGDGPSNTIQFAEYNGPPIHWMSPVDLQFSTMSFTVGDPTGIDSQYLNPAVANADGSVRRLESDLTPSELRAMCTANGGESQNLNTHTEKMEDGRKRPLKP